MKPMRALGIMSGTSMDGVDYAVCAIDDRIVKLEALWRVGFPKALRRRIQDAAAGSATSWETAQLHHDLGRFYAAGATRGPAGKRPALVGLHGQTIFHHPDEQAPATFQIGEPAYLAQLMGTPVISNFRAADLAVGGQGAPLASVFHLRVFGIPGRHVCVNNLGGISNVTSIDWRSEGAPGIAAFDTGPANVLIDLAVQHFSRGREMFDKGGAWAARGRCCVPLLQRLLDHPFLSQPPPKSTGRELFGEPFFRGVLLQGRRWRLSRFDYVATLTTFTAESIALNYRLHLPSPPEVVVLAGGGAENPLLRSAIAQALARQGHEASVLTSADAGWPSSSIEPSAFALLAWLRWQRRAGNLPETTGARHGVICGQVTESPKVSQPPLRQTSVNRRNRG